MTTKIGEFTEGTTASAPTCKSRWCSFESYSRTSRTAEGRAFPTSFLRPMGQCVRSTVSLLARPLRFYEFPRRSPVLTFSVATVPNSRSDPAVPALSASPFKTPLISEVSARNEARKSSAKRIGLYTLQASAQDLGNLPRNTWKAVERTCLHNALVCAGLGEDAKRSVRPR
jgi:hypothetical protein